MITFTRETEFTQSYSNYSRQKSFKWYQKGNHIYFLSCLRVTGIIKVHVYCGGNKHKTLTYLPWHLRPLCGFCWWWHPWSRGRALTTGSRWYSAFRKFLCTCLNKNAKHFNSCFLNYSNNLYKFLILLANLLY